MTNLNETSNCNNNNTTKKYITKNEEFFLNITKEDIKYIELMGKIETWKQEFIHKNSDAFVKISKNVYKDDLLYCYTKVDKFGINIESFIKIFGRYFKFISWEDALKMTKKSRIKTNENN